MAVSRYYSSVARRTTLTADATAIATTLTVAAATGFPSLYPYTLIIDQDTVDEEIVEVTNRSGTTLTVTRGVDGTTATAHTAGASVEHGVSARDFAESRTHEDTDAGVHGVTGDVVGTTDAQVLSNKTLGTNLAAGGFKITGLADPASAQDAVTKNWAETGMTSQLASASAYAAAASASASDSAASAVAASSSAASALASAAAASVSATTASTQAASAIFYAGSASVDAATATTQAASAQAFSLSASASAASALASELAASGYAAAAGAATIITAKGDLIVGSASAVADNLAVGTDGFVLTASAAAPLGVAWSAGGGGSAGFAEILFLGGM